MNRNVIDSKVAGIYQDIDVVPGSELNVNFISTSPVFSDGAAGAKLKISNVEQNRVLFDSRLNGMGPYPTGKLSAMVNIPNDINRVRISFYLFLPQVELVYKDLRESMVLVIIHLIIMVVQ